MLSSGLKDQWMRAEAALGSQEGHTGAAVQTWVRSRACAVRRKQRPGDDACVHGDRLRGCRQHLGGAGHVLLPEHGS